MHNSITHVIYVNRGFTGDVINAWDAMKRDFYLIVCTDCATMGSFLRVYTSKSIFRIVQFFLFRSSAVEIILCLVSRTSRCENEIRNMYYASFLLWR